MKQLFDTDTLAILGLGVLAFIDWIDPAVKIGILVVAIMTLIFKIIKDRKEEKRAEELERRTEELEKEKRAEEREEHELRMKLLQKELEEKERKS